MKFSKETLEKLTNHFNDYQVKFKPSIIKNGKALAFAYVDARTILDRLDEVVGTENWQDEYQVISPNQVICKLTINGVTKSDAGEAGSSEKEPLKSAVSDALKRAAVKFGVGRYLYKLPKKWYPYDEAKGEFKEIPSVNMPHKEEMPAINAEEVDIPECSSCNEKITNRVALFSAKYYGKPYCMKCQNVIMQEKAAKTTKDNIPV